MKRVPIATALGIVCALAFRADAQKSDDKELLTVGVQAPKLDVEHWITNGNGQFEPVTEFQPEKIYVIAFWSTQSAPSVEGLPHLVQLQQRHAPRGVQVINISSEPLEEVENFLAKQVPGQPNAELTIKNFANSISVAADPDGSAFEKYVNAAGQFSLPTAFIVGKDGIIEWLGPVAQLAGPLEEVAIGIWDRTVARATTLASQRKGILLNKISQEMKDGNPEAAMKHIEQAEKDYASDANFRGYLGRVRINVRQYPATQLAREGKFDEALEALNELLEVEPGHRFEIIQTKYGVLIHAERFDEAASVVDEMVAALREPVPLNQIAWMIYELSLQHEDFSEKLLAAATASVKKALEVTPKEGAILDTYAHLLHRAGNLDAAIEAQTKAAQLVDHQKHPKVKPFLEELKKEKEAGKP